MINAFICDIDFKLRRMHNFNSHSRICLMKSVYSPSNISLYSLIMSHIAFAASSLVEYSPIIKHITSIKALFLIGENVFISTLAIFELLRASNKYIDETTPWTLAKDETLTDRLETVLYNLLEAIRVSAVLLNPFLTKTSESIFEQINTECKDLKYNEENEYSLNKPTALFMRIDVK